MKQIIHTVALWGKMAPAHSITTLMITDDQKTIVTGSLEGQICLWHLSIDMKVSSKAMLFGHTASITCLAKARDFEKQPYVVSSSENGEMCVWNVINGHCIENVKLPYTHTAIYFYHCSFRMTGEGWLLCCGHYPDVLIIDAKTLQVLHSFSSQSSDWISCMCIVRSTRIQEDSLVAVSFAGDLKVWNISSSINSIQEKQNIYEAESKPLDSTQCRAVRFCTYTERLLLVICSNSWKVYDYCDFSMLCSDNCKKGQYFAGGEFLAANRLIIWTEDGHSYIYQLLNSGLPKSIYPNEGGLVKETITPHLLCSTNGEEKGYSYAMGFMNQRKEPFFKVLYSGDESGRIHLWHIPDVLVLQFDGPPLELQIETTITLQEIFDSHKSMAEGIIDHLCTPQEGRMHTTVTSSVYIHNLDKLVCGCEDGNIVITLALHAARARLLEDHPLLKGTLPHKIFKGHSCSVTSLLYPHGRSEKFDPSWLISGDKNSTVIWRDIFTGEIFHKFTLQAGSVLKLLVPPDHYKVKLFQSIYCLCSDNSVALLNLQERICLFHGRKHLFPVKTMKWHPIEDVLIVGCEDGSVYVWDIDTGTLERHETGEMAKAILKSCEDFNFVMIDTVALASQETSRNKRVTPKTSNSYKLGHLPHNLMLHSEKTSHKPADSKNGQSPFTVLPIRTKYNISLHLLLFDLEKVFELLQSSQESRLKSAKSFHSYDALKVSKGSSEKRPLTLKRNRTAGSLSQMDGQVSETNAKENTIRPLEESVSIKRNKKFKSTKKDKTKPSGKVDVNMVMDAAKLLISCLLPWGLDKELDNFCIRHLDILKLHGSVSFGTISDEDHVSLMLPGWNETNKNKVENLSHNLFSQKVVELSTKYAFATEKHKASHGKQENNSLSTLGLDTLLQFLKKIFLVNKTLKMDTDSKFATRPRSQEKMESVRSKWKNSENVSSSVPAFPVELLQDRNGQSFPDAENISLIKIVSSWRDQSVQVTEAMQAVLLAEVKKQMQSLQETLIFMQSPATMEVEKTTILSKMDLSDVIELQPIKSNPLQTTPESLEKNEVGSKTVNFQEPEGTNDKCGMEDSESPDDLKQNPWMSKVCYCKVC
ncbi:WD repeat-containing protein 72 [Bombina bombina]|uniref:WD repeat-containing protein 72 n=1 Tax=Bombina bombina TaxID=8345 RepID=UPI00235B1EC6|nr:WD repeat-containing protein 72 [Bombina bombina]